MNGYAAMRQRLTPGHPHPGADVLRALLDDATGRVVAVAEGEVTDDAVAVRRTLVWEQTQFAVAERVVASGRVGPDVRLHRVFLVAELVRDRRSDPGARPEEVRAVAGRDRDQRRVVLGLQAAAPVNDAAVCAAFTNDVLTADPLVLIHAVVTILDAITDEQRAHTLGVVATAAHFRLRAVLNGKLAEASPDACYFAVLDGVAQLVKRRLQLGDLLLDLVGMQVLALDSEVRDAVLGDLGVESERRGGERQQQDDASTPHLV